ncbi:MAG: glucose sorbosone dehydrogenase, partial [Pricia sp.]|nr:glucose sorbosone dehydrogenase [Pricia sp.]
MKYLRIVSLAIVTFYFLSCADDNAVDAEVPTETEDPQDQGDDDGQNDDEETITLVNAFPNLSFSQPLDLQSGNNNSNKIYVAEKKGTIKVFENNPEASTTETFLDLGNIATTSEQGLLGFAFHPNFSSNGFFYVFYTPVSSVALVSRFTVSQTDPRLADADSELVILEIPQPHTNHNGGQLAFGLDGYLYISVGDGGGAGDTDGNAQNRANLLGTILRIDVDNTQVNLNYSIPPDNPFVDGPDFRSEINAYGFRNPWRMSFDTQTGKLWTGDV